MSRSTALSKLLRRRRKQYGLTLREAAEILGCSCSHVSLMEAGACNPRLDLLQRIAREYRLGDAEILRAVRGR